MKSEIKRVKLRVFDPKTTESGEYIEYRWSKKTKQCRITTLEDGSVEYKLLPNKVISLEEVLLEWEHGPTPTPRASRKYTKEQLKSFGYSEELINTIYRGYTSKTIDSVCDNFSCSRKEAKKLLEQYKFISKIPGYLPDKKDKVKKVQRKKNMDPKKIVMRKDNFLLKKSNRNQKRKESNKKLGRR